MDFDVMQTYLLAVGGIGVLAVIVVLWFIYVRLSDSSVRTEALRRMSKPQTKIKDAPELNPIAQTVKNHLQAMHRHFGSAPNYARSAPYWRQLESSEVFAFLSRCFDQARETSGPMTGTERTSAGLVVCTVIDTVDPDRIRAAFAPSGYLSCLERYGYFNAPQQGLPATAVVLGHNRAQFRVDVSWLPPLDGKPYHVVLAQDILTAEERRQLGL